MRNLTPSGGAQATGVSAAGNFVSAVDWNYGGEYLWNSTDPLHLTFIATARVPVSFRSEIDIARDVVYVLGAYSKGSGVHTVPLSVLLNAPNGVVYPPYLQPAWSPHERAVHDLRVHAVGGAHGRRWHRVLRQVRVLRGRPRQRRARHHRRDRPGQHGESVVGTLGPTYIKTAQGMGVAAKGNFLYVAAGMLGVRVYEFPGLSNPAP